MANYMLLRNNKESGPYSLDGLMELGLKPYDLIWIHGKSAAWRYPSEVEELKGIAPAVEEQPFDRFFKKSEEKSEKEEKKETPVAVEIPQPQKIESATIKPEHEKYVPKKSVYVTLPGQKNVAAQQNVAAQHQNGWAPQPAKEPIKDQVKEPIPQPVRETVASVPVQPTITISENPVAAQVKYSQPLDEIKEMYVKTLQNRKQKIARKSFWMQNLKKAAVLLCFVAVGVIVGFVINSNGSKQKGSVQQQVIAETKPGGPQVAAILPETNNSEISNPDTTIAAIEDIQPMRQPSGGYVNKNPAQQENAVEPNPSADNPVTTNQNKKEVRTPVEENKQLNSFLPENVETNPATGERSRKVRSKTTETGLVNNNAVTEKTNEKKPVFTSNLSRLVSVKSNDYKRVAFGGIRDLQLTITNDSKYVLDNVIVELQYIKPNEMPLKTESIEFTSVGPNATSTIRVPDTNRGIRVNFRITHIKSRQMDEVVSGN